jgi:uncharacterized NAD(P)/FAD-binding protein YdhS
MERAPLIAVVGSGFCGTTLAIHLLRDAGLAPARVVLIERPGHGVGGVAYDVASDEFLLNVPAHRMSAFEDAPTDFLDFVRGRVPDAGRAHYARRREYGEYLAARLDAAARAALAGEHGGVRLEPVAGTVRDLARDPLGRLRLVVDTELTALELLPDAVLLATGNAASAPPRWVEPWMVTERRYADAWAPGSLSCDEGTRTVVLVGTGLTMVDAVVELRARGYRDRIVAVSRHGLLPRVDDGPPPAPVDADLPPLVADAPPSVSARALLRALRTHADVVAADGRDWRSLIAAVRPHVPALWGALDARERRRWQRHARTYWEIHRHRMPAALAQRIGAEIRSGGLELLAGRIHGARRADDGAIELEFRARGAGESRTLCADRLVNCTGAAAGAPLPPPWPALVERGAACRDPLGLGVLTDESGRLLDRDGRAQADLWYAGPMWRAQQWEMTAVPELRRRLPAVAASIAALVGARRAGPT